MAATDFRQELRTSHLDGLNKIVQVATMIVVYQVEIKKVGERTDLSEEGKVELQGKMAMLTLDKIGTSLGLPGQTQPVNSTRPNR